MPKKGKTRREKIEADLKRKSVSSVSKKADNIAYSTPAEEIKPTVETRDDKISYTFQKTKSKAIAIEYPHLIGDLKKTTLLSIFVIIVQVAVKLSLNI